MAACAVLALSVAAFAGCTDKTGGNGTHIPGGNGNLVEYSNFFSMGTTGTLVVTPSKADQSSLTVAQRNERFADFNEEAGDLLSEIEGSISSSYTQSYIYKFNQAEPDSWVTVDKMTYDLLTTAKSMYTLTGGSYNPAVWYCVDLYGFTTRPSGSEAMPYDRQAVTKEDGTRYLPLPDSRYVTAFQQLSQGFAEVQLKEEDGTYSVYKPSTTVTVDGRTYNLRLDLGGIGKGYAADGVYALMEEYGYPYGYFNFGSSSISVRQYENNATNEYTLSTRDPRGIVGTTYCSFKIKNVSLSTSGDYEQYYVDESGTRYCHIIDPSTGSPIQTGVASVTVIGGSAAEDDALTTALSAMGKQRAAEFINANPDFFAGRVVVMLVFEDGVGKVITNSPDSIQITNSDYKLASKLEGGKIVLL